MTLAIVGSSGGMKSVFVQGVLNALETGGLRADAYAGASGSALPAVGAAVMRCNFVGAHYWQRVNEVRKQGYDMGETMLNVLREWITPEFTAELFQPGVPRLFISATAVTNDEAAQQTQGDGAKRLGRKLLVDAGRKDKSWVENNLALHLFDTSSVEEYLRLTATNLAEVVYASLRMLHFARIPAWVQGRPYVDTSYTCVCPAMEMVERGYDEVIAISTEPGQLYRDIFQSEPIPAEYHGKTIRVIQPDFDLSTLGADFTDCTDDGLLAAFHYGEEKGRDFLATR